MRDIVRRVLGWKAAASDVVGNSGDILRWVLRWPGGFGEPSAAADFEVSADVEMRLIAAADVEL